MRNLIIGNMLSLGGERVLKFSELQGHWQRKFLLLHLKEHEKISWLAV
jgi:hypothetical protein